MATELWGRRSGPSDIRPVKIANTAAVVKGDFLKHDGAGSPYYTPCAAGDRPICVAMESCDAPTADGDISINAEHHPDAQFEYPPDAGTVDETLIGKTCDIGGAQSIDIDASADDVIVIEKVNIEKNSLLVRVLFDAGRTGVA